VAIEVLSIVAFLLGSPLYVQRFAETSQSAAPASDPNLPVQQQVVTD
jgi:hypothetical protein